MLEKPVQYQEMMTSFLKGDRIVKYLSFGILFRFSEESRCEAVIQQILDNWSDRPLSEKIEIISAIEVAISDAKQSEDDNILNRIRLFKQTLSPENNWKSFLLNVSLEAIHDHHAVPFQFNPDAMNTLKIADKNRFKFFYNEDKSSYALMGSTFITNKKHILAVEQNAEKHIMDAIYVARTLDNDNSSLLIQINDGCGGHFGDKVQDAAIARAAHFTGKHLARLMSIYDDPDELKENLASLFPLLEQEIRSKNPKSEEGTTLIAARVFKVNDGYRLIGCGLGDSMLIAWDPNAENLLTLIPSCVQVFSKGQEATAIFPTAYQNKEIKYLDATLPEGSIVLACTDGFIDHLPVKQDGKHDANDNAAAAAVHSNVIERHLDADILNSRLKELLGQKITPKNLVKQLVAISMENLEVERENAMAKAAAAVAKLPELEAQLREKEIELKEKQQQLDQQWKQLRSQHENDPEVLEQKQSALRDQEQQLQTEFQLFIADLGFEKFSADKDVQLGDDVACVAATLKF